MRPRPIQGKRALVTGASGGLGAEFARELARRGAALIIVARSDEALQTLARELRASHGIQVEVLTADLSLATAAQDLYDRVSAEGWEVDILVNNAGLGLYGRNDTIPWYKEQSMLQIDVVTVAGLTKLFLPQMLERRFGYVLNVSSLMGYQPMPLYATYAAAKTFVQFYSEALKWELRGTGVSVTVVAPGITSTDFLKVSGQQATAYQRVVMMRSPDVAYSAIGAMLAGRTSVVPGMVNTVTAWFGRFAPRAVAVPVAELLMKSNEPQH